MSKKDTKDSTSNSFKDLDVLEDLKQWLLIFNLIIKIIGESESELAPTAIKVKMQRWLKMPRPEFDDKSALEFMLKGKTRQVRNILEQRLG